MTQKQLDWQFRRMIIIGIGAIISFLIGAITATAAPKEGTQMAAYLIGFTFLGLVVSYVTLLFVDPKPKDNSKPAAAVDPDLTREINDIVNSGREPSLIVQQLKQLTESRP